MQELIDLIGGLSKEEQDWVRNYLRNFKEDLSNSSKLSQAFDDILNSVDKTEIQFSPCLPLESKLAMNKIQSRLFHAILESFLSESALEKDFLYGIAEKNALRIRKLALKYRALLIKKSISNSTVLNHLLNHISSEAKRFELYDVLLEILEHKRSRIFLIEGDSAVENLDKEIEYYRRMIKIKLLAHENYLRLVSNKGLVKKLNAKQLVKFRDDCIQRMEIDLEFGKSKTVEYFLLTFKLDKFIEEEEFEIAEKICLQLLELVENNVCLYVKDRIGIILDNYSMVKCFQSDFNKALELVFEAKKYMRFNSYNSFASYEQQFYIHFYAGNYLNAIEINQRLIRNSFFTMGAFITGKYFLQRAAVLFKLNRFKESLAVCSEWLEIEREKGRWDLGLRYLRIMNCVELEKFDQASAQIEALRKFISRNRDLETRQRDIVIYSLFNQLSRAGFVFERNQKIVLLLNSLKSKDKQVNFKYYTHELIRTDDWLFNKLKFSNQKKVAV